MTVAFAVLPFDVVTVIVAVPFATPVTTPFETVATLVLLDVHVTALLVAFDGEILGLYILHPNNVGRCSHIANASYAVSSKARGKHIGQKLVFYSIEKAKELDFIILQFNAVVEDNFSASHLYEKLGFKQLGVIPKGFRLDNDEFVNICPYYIEL